MDVSTIVNIILCVLSFILAAISVVTVVITLRQNNKMIEESTRPFISVYTDEINAGNPFFYLVIKNFGKSTAYITKFEYDFDFNGCYKIRNDRDYLQQLNNAQIIRYIKSRQVWGVETVDDIQIIKNGLINSKVGKVHYWTVQGLVKVVRSNSIVSKEKASMYSANFAIKMVIVRQNPLEHKDGVAIMKFFIEQIHDEN